MSSDDAAFLSQEPDHDAPRPKQARQRPAVGTALALIPAEPSASSAPRQPEAEIIPPDSSRAGRGRPSSYSQQIAEQILDLLATGKSVAEICRREDMPDRSTVWHWMRRHEDFYVAYVRARAMGAEAGVDEMQEIADDAREDWVETPEGPRLNVEHVQRSKLRIETKKWTMGRMSPKRFGDRVDMHVTAEERPISALSNDQLEQQMTALLAKGFGAREVKE